MRRGLRLLGPVVALSLVALVVPFLAVSSPAVAQAPPGIEGDPAFFERLLQRYVHRVMGVSTYDPNARRALLEVFTMMAPPQRMLRPGVMARVIRDLFQSNVSVRFGSAGPGNPERKSAAAEA